MEKRAITEKEAIAILTRDIQTLEGQRDGEMEEGEEYLEAHIFAVHAIAEVRQYRKIGTIKECRELACIVSMVERNSLAKVISEWLAYRKLGSIEELQAIVGRQGPMQETEGHGGVSPDTQA